MKNEKIFSSTVATQWLLLWLRKLQDTMRMEFSRKENEISKQKSK